MKKNNCSATMKEIVKHKRANNSLEAIETDVTTYEIFSSEDGKKCVVDYRPLIKNSINFKFINLI